MENITQGTKDSSLLHSFHPNFSSSSASRNTSFIPDVIFKNIRNKSKICVKEKISPIARDASDVQSSSHNSKFQQKPRKRSSIWRLNPKINNQFQKISNYGTASFSPRWTGRGLMVKKKKKKQKMNKRLRMYICQ